MSKKTWQIISWNLNTGNFDILMNDGLKFRMYARDWDGEEDDFIELQCECGDACQDAGMPMWRWDEYENKEVLDTPPYDEDSYYKWSDEGPPTPKHPIPCMPIFMENKWNQVRVFRLRCELRKANAKIVELDDLLDSARDIMFERELMEDS